MEGFFGGSKRNNHLGKTVEKYVKHWDDISKLCFQSRNLKIICRVPTYICRHVHNLQYIIQREQSGCCCYIWWATPTTLQLCT
jgi:hypothetical protein